MLVNNSCVLAIDTSCDETAAAVVRGTTVLSNVVASQVELHKPYGGVFPTVAKQAHKENIDRVIALTLKRAQRNWSEIDALAVTEGPGLAPALEVGITKAKELAELHQLPLYPVNHIEGHVLSVLAQPKNITGNKTPPTTPTIHFPVLSVIVSGGHTEFVLITAIGKYQRLGWTIDDAAGEALDKVGRMWDLGYPAGPVIEQFAQFGNDRAYDFPLPMTSSGDYNLSFSGLKTFARRFTEQLESGEQLNKQTIYDLCASFQRAVFRHICHKLNKILIDHPDLGEVWLGGGVAANATLRVMLRQTIKKHLQTMVKKELVLPLSPKLRGPYSKKLCGDNAAMIGVVATQNKTIKPNQTFDRTPNLQLN
jgi:N6-L-threonylcarbamoyladenine synthase